MEVWEVFPFGRACRSSRSRSSATFAIIVMRILFLLLFSKYNLLIIIIITYYLFIKNNNTSPDRPRLPLLALPLHRRGVRPPLRLQRLPRLRVCVCARARACVCACVCVCARACGAMKRRTLSRTGLFSPRPRAGQRKGMEARSSRRQRSARRRPLERLNDADATVRLAQSIQPIEPSLARLGLDSSICRTHTLAVLISNRGRYSA